MGGAQWRAEQRKEGKSSKRSVHTYCFPVARFFLHPSPSSGRAEAIYASVDDLSFQQAVLPVS
jgi:hypothetical protein